MTASLGGLAFGVLCVAPLLAVAGCSTIDPDAVVNPVPGATSPVSETTVPVEPTAVVTIASVEADGSGAVVGGLVTGIEVSGGQCTFILIPGVGEIVRVETESLSNVNSTSCGSPLVPMSSLASGSWSVTLRFDGDDMVLESEPLQLEIP